MPRVFNNFRLCSYKSSIRMPDSCNPHNRNLTRRVDSSNYLERYSLYWVICSMKNYLYSFSQIGFPSKYAFTIRSAIMSIKDRLWQARSYRSLENLNICSMQKGSKCQKIHAMSIRLSWMMTGTIFWMYAQKEIPVLSSKRISLFWDFISHLWGEHRLKSRMMALFLNYFQY